MKFGKFSSNGREFIISNPNTPRPWINYLTNEEYCAIISHCAGGYSFYQDCRSNRILRWAPENWHFDRPGRYVFVRDVKKGSFFSTTYQPLRKPFEKYEAIHGLGYTTISTQYSGIETVSTFFVPVKDTCEVWKIRVTNKTKKQRLLQIFPYIEWLIGDYHLELRYRNIMNLYNRTWYDSKTNTIHAKKTADWGDMDIGPFRTVLFFSSSLPVKGYATQKDSFLGEYNTEENPETLKTGKFKNFKFTSGEDTIGCFKHQVSLKPGQTIEFSIVLGETGSGEAEAAKIVKKYRDMANVNSELDRVKELWIKRITDNIIVETPDKDFNNIINTWVKYQMYICNFWSRSPSYYHEGSGGRGYRDSCQDAEAIMSINTQLSKKKMLTIAKLIRLDGTSAPGWSDTRGPGTYRPNKDHQIWLTSTVAAYIKETGDKSILFEKLPYLKDKWIQGWYTDENFKGEPRFEGEGTLYDHLWKNLDFCFNDVGDHGLPLIGHADWNDAIDSAGIKHKGQSVWLGQALVRSLKILAELSELIEMKDKVLELQDRAQIMSDRVDKFWDGQWYARGITDDGFIYGSSKNKEGKIYLNSQSWAILAGIPDPDKREKMLKAVDRYLDGKHGYALFYPAYSQWDSKLGRISMFSEGTKENAAVFCHAATFMVAANCMIGRGDKAYEAMRKIMPATQKNYDLYKTEPYSYSEYIVGPEHPYLYGEGAFTWITGTAGWTFLAATEYLLGIQRDYKGLRIDPCIPKKWKSFKMVRPFRGNVYEIQVENPQGIEKGVAEVYVNGEKIDGNLIPSESQGKYHKVRVVMGKPKVPKLKKKHSKEIVMV
ncbi:MAG: hypothetical protein ABII27_02410 [bacterium]